MGIRDLGCTLRTLSHLGAQQFAAQMKRRLTGPARYPDRHLLQPTELELGAGALGPSPAGEVVPAGIALCGRPGTDPVAAHWNLTGSPLWVYSMHYHSWLQASSMTLSSSRATVLSWIAVHTHGVGWEPYPTAMRLLYWTGWLSQVAGYLDPDELALIRASMGAQLRHLAQHVELHLDGNHVWTNLAAMAVASMVLRGPGLPKPARALTRFARVVQQQLAEDGVHRERTPSYHILLAEQLAIVTDIARSREPRHVDALERALGRMALAATCFVHPDGDVALWGDSQREAPTNPRSFCERTGLVIPEVGDVDAPYSGFYRRAFGPWTVLMNRGDIGLEQQPGHIHADALAIELSLGRTRVLVDAGAGTYSLGKDRDYARSTAAHNTVTVGSQSPDQHELWASHRVGGRARLRRFESSAERLCGSVEGYLAPASHTREVRWADGKLRIRDTVSQHVPAVARFFLPASARVSTEGPQLIASLGDVRFSISNDNDMFEITLAEGWHGIGRAALRLCLSVEVPQQGLNTDFLAL